MSELVKVYCELISNIHQKYNYIKSNTKKVINGHNTIVKIPLYENGIHFNLMVCKDISCKTCFNNIIFHNCFNNIKKDIYDNSDLIDEIFDFYNLLNLENEIYKNIYIDIRPGIYKDVFENSIDYKPDFFVTSVEIIKNNVKLIRDTKFTLNIYGVKAIYPRYFVNTANIFNSKLKLNEEIPMKLNLKIKSKNINNQYSKNVVNCFILFLIRDCAYYSQSEDDETFILNDGNSALHPSTFSVDNVTSAILYKRKLLHFNKEQINIFINHLKNNWKNFEKLNLYKLI
jgi:hypothetical protein